MGRRWRQGYHGTSHKFLLYCLALLVFLLLWCILTIIIMMAQERLFESDGEDAAESDDISTKAKDTNLHNVDKGVQVIVGYYSGSLPPAKRHNLTRGDFDANNFSPVKGFGQGGLPVQLSIDEELEAERTFTINQFNLWASDRIALDRGLPGTAKQSIEGLQHIGQCTVWAYLTDMRRQECRSKSYPPVQLLPNTSVIIVYHNEAFSTLARTITSVVTRSPRQLLHELILVDDFSNRTFLLDDLEKFAMELPVKVKIIRARERVGLIRARMLGAEEAGGQVLTFLDSHCECSKGWLEPLLTRITADRRTISCPIIDVINDRTFAYQRGLELFRGGFNWNLQFRWYAAPPSATKRRSGDLAAPIESPTMAGGLFSIDRGYFQELGGYDMGMEIWGGENIELSLRAWMCGGRIELLPCSHVGHVFRKASPHDFPSDTNSSRILQANLVRVSEVWMDEWKAFFFRVSPPPYFESQRSESSKLRNGIDVSDRVELRKRLQCRDFSWYLENVWIDHFLPTPVSTFGRLVNIDSNYCMSSKPTEAGKQHRLTFTKCTLGFDLWQASGNIPKSSNRFQ